MLGSIVNRLIHAVTVLFGVVSVTFLLLHMAGDPLAGLVPPGATIGHWASNTPALSAVPCAVTSATRGGSSGRL